MYLNYTIWSILLLSVIFWTVFLNYQTKFWWFTLYENINYKLNHNFWSSVESACPWFYWTCIFFQKWSGGGTTFKKLWFVAMLTCLINITLNDYNFMPISLITTYKKGTKIKVTKSLRKCDLLSEHHYDFTEKLSKNEIQNSMDRSKPTTIKYFNLVTGLLTGHCQLNYHLSKIVRSAREFVEVPPKLQNIFYANYL